METVVVYYSWSGKTERLAKTMANDAVLCEIRDVSKPGKAAAYTKGIVNARRMSPTPIEPLSVKLENYDRIVIMSPVWAGHPAPPVCNIFNALPPGKQVEVIMTSISGKSSAREKVRELIEKCGSQLTDYRDVKL